NVGYTNLAQVLKSQVERLKGITVKLTPFGVAGGPGIGAANITVLGALTNPTTTYPQICNRFCTRGSSNQQAYSSPAFDAAIKEATSTTDAKAQNAAFKKAGKALMDEYEVI